MLELLSSKQMRDADAATVKSGTPAAALMERAGHAVALKIAEQWEPCPVLVLCGPGNNGGDGKIAARILKEKGWPVRVETMPFSSDISLDGIGLVVDAVFGTGLSRPLGSDIRKIFAKIADLKTPVVAVDTPSGLDADSGEVAAGTPKCVMTVTFCRKKIGHMLLPGKTYCGTVHVVDIGISDQAVIDTGANVFENHPGLWLPDYPIPHASAHKYRRGHALVLGGPKMTGAAKLAGIAAARMGAGMVTLAVPQKSFDVYASGNTPSLIIQPMRTSADFKKLLADPKRDVALLGPGAGVSKDLEKMTLAALSTKKPLVLDADVLTAFAKKKSAIGKKFRGTVMTPHEGEFKRFFGKLAGSKLDRARKAAQKSGAIIVLKGSDTIIAAHDGTAVINGNAPPSLATAGSGDVLAGMILGLLAQQMPVFQACLAAVWIHGEAARAFGPGLIASDIPDIIPNVLNSLFFNKKS